MILLPLAWACVDPFPPHLAPQGGHTGGTNPTEGTGQTAVTGLTGHTGVGVDDDMDGQSPPLDCDDSDPTIYDGAPEDCENLVDEDCDGADARCVATGEQVVALIDAGSVGGGFVVGEGGNLDADPEPEVVLASRNGQVRWFVHDWANDALTQAGTGMSDALPLYNWVSIGSGHDVDGDALDDLVVGWGGSGGNGSIQLVTDVLAKTPSVWTWEGDGGFGYDVTLIPDYDGDGAPDIWAGRVVGSSSAGAVLLSTSALGKAGGGPLNPFLEADLTVELLDGDGASYGGTVAAGDITGDGEPELMVGVAGDVGPGTANPAADPMAVYVYQSGLQTPQTGPPQFQNGMLTIFHGNPTDDSVWDGLSVAASADPSVGDVDGDGCDDLVSAMFFDEAGRGSASLLLGCQAFPLVAGPGEADARILGPTAASPTGFGAASAVIPRFDGDAGGELVVSAPSTQTLDGAVHVFSGSGLAGVLDMDLAPPNLLLSIQGVTGVDQLGWSVAHAGDLNQDSYGDLLMAEADGGGGTAEVWVVLGGALDLDP